MKSYGKAKKSAHAFNHTFTLTCCKDEVASFQVEVPFEDRLELSFSIWTEKVNVNEYLNTCTLHIF
jgi:hypothetical protein